MLRSVPLPRSGLVLDAGCGRGQFLPLLQKALGDSGKLVAVDLAREHVRHLADPVARAVADVRALPFRPGTFDAVWCANVTQYFDDAVLAALLDEFRRVLKPGGLLAVKDLDMTGWRIEPAPPFCGLHLAEASAAPGGTEQSFGSIRGRRLRRILEQAHFDDVSQNTVVIERFAPLAERSARFWSDWLTYLAGLTRGVPLGSNELEFWDGLSTAAGARRFVSQPDFYGSEMQTIAFGWKPLSNVS